MRCLLCWGNPTWKGHANRYLGGGQTLLRVGHCEEEGPGNSDICRAHMKSQQAFGSWCYCEGLFVGGMSGCQRRAAKLEEVSGVSVEECKSWGRGFDGSRLRKVLG